MRFQKPVVLAALLGSVCAFLGSGTGVVAFGSGMNGLLVFGVIGGLLGWVTGLWLMARKS